MRWLKGEEDDLWQRKVMIWGQKANNREQWATVLKEPTLLNDT
jgi:hypothetical protein